MANFLESKIKALNNAVTANIYNKQFIEAMGLGTDTPEDYIDRCMTVEAALDYYETVKSLI